MTSLLIAVLMVIVLVGVNQGRAFAAQGVITEVNPSGVVGKVTRVDDPGDTTTYLLIKLPRSSQATPSGRC